MILFYDGPFSQWYPVSFAEGPVVFQTAEHYTMFHKAMLFGDDETATCILRTHRPQEAKRLGRSVKGFDQVTWDQHKEDIVYRGNYLKFTQHNELRVKLLETGVRILAEANPYDRIWGIGLARTNPKARNPLQWNGQNLLGKALMRLRSELASCEHARQSCVPCRFASTSCSSSYRTTNRPCGKGRIAPWRRDRSAE